ncbi:uncharacterized protein K444DRAFT_633387 [Hyaloscypha bicolor E]|uniref:Uncharacterized protein n=1 Tax=Hyaloscypha bicolor E TaxID=1095630 RepID=A0A2J6SYL6_9HELO|nr:uncharacterized protein K444DRAFT_633387 [Hyaloscypha bicolor E]PMD55859.1 hypothetical protein K444DRAFT_633387 [Hyaloscypha bicolor E]
MHRAAPHRTAPHRTEHLFVSGRLTSSSQRGTRRLPPESPVSAIDSSVTHSLCPSVPPSRWMNEQHPLCGKASAILDMKMMKAQAQAQPGPAQPTHPPPFQPMAPSSVASESNSRPRAKSAALDGVRDPHPAAEILAANEVPAWLRSSPDRVRAGKKERGGFFLQSFGMLGRTDPA